MTADSPERPDDITDPDVLDLVANLPRCTLCVKRHATKARARGGARYCDPCARTHAPDAADYPRAAGLRRVLARIPTMRGEVEGDGGGK